ncbi:MAG TPA: asparaginase [archaeon]|nr:asparaginase [archaeon]
MPSKKKKICLVFCGGTIAMLPNRQTGALEPAKSAEELLELVPKVREIADVDSIELFNIDSSDMTSAHWTMIAKEIFSRYEKYDGFLVTHGTDTMADTASALAFAFGKNINKPVVLTGAQCCPETIGTDAKFNLENAFRAAASDFAGVMISFGHFVFEGVRTQKRHESDFNAFISPAFSELASIRSKIHWTKFAKKRKLGKCAKLFFEPDFEPGILSVKINAGVGPEMLDNLVKTKGIKGLVLESLGAGNIPGRYLPAVKEAVGRDIPVLIVSPFVGGSTAGADTYKLGLDALEAGVIPTGNMTFVATYVKLMWCLAKLHRQNNKTAVIPKIRKMFEEDFVGEITL